MIDADYDILRAELHKLGKMTPEQYMSNPNGHDAAVLLIVSQLVAKARRQEKQTVIARMADETAVLRKFRQSRGAR